MKISPNVLSILSMNEKSLIDKNDKQNKNARTPFYSLKKAQKQDKNQDRAKTELSVYGHNDYYNQKKPANINSNLSSEINPKFSSPHHDLVRLLLEKKKSEIQINEINLRQAQKTINLDMPESNNLKNRKNSQ